MAETELITVVVLPKERVQDLISQSNRDAAAAIASRKHGRKLTDLSEIGQPQSGESFNQTNSGETSHPS